MPHVGHAGVVDQRHQGVEGPGVNVRHFELEAVGEENSDNPGGQRLPQPQRAGDQSDHPLGGLPQLLVPVPLLVVVHVLQQPLEHLRVPGPEQAEPDGQDDVVHVLGVAAHGECPALLLVVVTGGTQSVSAVSALPAGGAGAAADHADPGGGRPHQDGRVREDGLAGPDLPAGHQASPRHGRLSHSEGELGGQAGPEDSLTVPHQLHTNYQLPTLLLSLLL